MASIDDLKVSYLLMSPAEQYSLIRTIRELRRTRPESSKNFKKATKGTRSADTSIKKAKGVSKIDPLTLLNTLSKGEKEKLLKELGYL